jgi:uncharacterized membrane protein YfbV (UPF0208 family)
MNTLTEQILHDLEQLPEAMQSETLDFVQFLKKKLEQNKTTLAIETKPNGQVLADILEEASKHKLFTEIEDPGSWQREVRKDRPLPGRGKR